MPSYRLVVCIDFEQAKTLEEAYARLHDLMSHYEGGWETSDEWYRLGAGHDGPENPDELIEAMTAYYDAKKETPTP